MFLLLVMVLLLLLLIVLLFLSCCLNFDCVFYCMVWFAYVSSMFCCFDVACFIICSIRLTQDFVRSVPVAFSLRVYLSCTSVARGMRSNTSRVF